MRIFCIQMDIAWEDKAANHAKVTAMVDKAAPPPGSLVVLPEMFATGFSMDVGAASDTSTGETQQFLSELARQRQLFLMGGAVTTGAEGRGRNRCFVYGPDGQEMSTYANLHPFSPGGESRHYMPGDDLVSFRWGGFEVAPFICYDLRFPEIFRTAARRGATLLVVIANWPTPREVHWTTLIRARAIENQAYVVGVNRVGKDPSLSYSGRSMIVAPDGEILAEAGAVEEVIHADIELENVSAYRARLPFLEDMRGDFLR